MTFKNVLNIALILILSVPATAFAQKPIPNNIVQLSAIELHPVQQDWLTLMLVKHVQGVDTVTLQSQLSKSVEMALRQLTPHVREDKFEFSTRNFSIHPRHNTEGQIVGWSGSAELLLQGRDVAGLTNAAVQVRDFNIVKMEFSLSHEERQKIEKSVRSAAIKKFRYNAQQVAIDFGFERYKLLKITISDNGQYSLPQKSMMMTEAVTMADPGISNVQITVTGTVQLY